MTEYSNSLVRPNNAYNTLSTYNVSAPGTVHGPLPLAGTPSMNVQTVLNPLLLNIRLYASLTIPMGAVITRFPRVNMGVHAPSMVQDPVNKCPTTSLLVLVHVHHALSTENLADNSPCDDDSDCLNGACYSGVCKSTQLLLPGGVHGRGIPWDMVCLY